jgi:hypothetical protein
MDAYGSRFDADLVAFAGGVIGGGLAYLNLRLGELEEARVLLVELRRLDPADHVGAALLSHVLARHEAGGETGLDYPVRGWSVLP